MSTNNFRFYETMLKTNICEIVMEAGLASTREVKCTLLDTVLRAANAFMIRTAKSNNSAAIVAWNIDTQEWDVVQLNKIKSFKVLSGSLGSLSANPVTRQARSDYATPVTRPSSRVIDPAVLKTYSIPATTDRKSFYLSALRDGPCEITFTKADGSTRVMNATLETAKIDDLGLTPVGSGKTNTSTNRINVVDLDAKDWRSFDVDKVQVFKTLLKPATPVTPAQPTIDYADALRKGKYKIVFTKADGTERTMNATLMGEVVDAITTSPVQVHRNGKKDPDVITVIDLDINEWRSFNVNRVISFELLKTRRTTLTPVG